MLSPNGEARNRSGARAPSRPRLTVAGRKRKARYLVEAVERRLYLDTVQLVATAGPDTITISSTATQTTVTINGTPTLVPVSGTTLIEISAGAGDDLILVESTRVPVLVLGGADNDSLVLSPTQLNLDAIEAEVEFDGGSGSDSALINDQANSFDDTFEITDDSVIRGFFGGLLYSATELITLKTGFDPAAAPAGLSMRGGRGGAGDAAEGSGENTFDILSLPMGTSLVIHAGAGDDTINFSPFGLLLDEIAGPVTIHGEGGIDTVHLFDQNNAFPDAWDITASTAVRELFGGVTYHTIEALRINAGLISASPQPGAATRGGPEDIGDNTFNVASLSVPTTLNGGTGNDTFIAGSEFSLAALMALLTVNGQAGIDELIIDDTLNPANDSYTLSAVGVERNGEPVLSYATIERIVLRLGAGNNTVTVQSTAPGAPVTLSAGAGDDLVHIGAGDLISMGARVTVDGQAGDDRIVVNDQSAASDRNYTVTARDVSATTLPSPLLTYLGAEGLTLNASAGSNTIVVQETDPLTPLTILTGAGEDVVHVNTDATGSAEVIFTALEQLALLAIGSGGRARLAAGGATVLRLDALDITGTGTLDITDNALILDYLTGSPLATVRSLIAGGYSAGAWTGSGITSSTAAATPQRAVGYGEASAVFSTFPATFAGQSVDNTTVLVRYTRYGDANLDGIVNLQDFNRLAGGFGTATLWTQGNFNFDDAVTLQDFNRLAANFGLSV